MLTVAGVGDSLCVLSRNGRAIVMNKMHRLDIATEKERVRNNGGTVINNR
jgi:serine/threonine protein phosphatase PrpC